MLQSVLIGISNFREKRRDARYNINTSGLMRRDDYTVESENFGEITLYEPADWTLLRRSLSAFPYDPGEFTFIDIGCGRGRTLFVASEFGFRDVVGVEIEPILSREAAENIATSKVKGSISVETVDATSYELPAGNLYIFMFNPFHENVMRKFLEKLENREESGKIYVALMNPVHGYLFQSSEKFKELSVIRKLISVYPWGGFPVVTFEKI